MTRIRYGYVKNEVNTLFINLKISSYPIDILNIFRRFKNCRVISYSTHMRKFKLTQKEVINHFGSDEGCTVYNNKKKRYLIFYNDLDVYYKPITRRRWTLAHELGHILLKHFTISNKTKIFRNNLTDEEYDWMESEANRFASLLLANPMILYKIKIKNINDIMQTCKLSIEASTYRFKDYLKWIKNKYINKLDIKIINQFHDFIYRKYCSICGHAFISENAKFCPICGNKKLLRGDGKMHYREGVKLDKNNHATVCPKCGNEDIKEDDSYCPICGGFLIQKCSDKTDADINGNEYIIENSCGCITMESNARFCPVCGNPTTFSSYGYLKPWKKEYDEIIEEEQYDGLIATAQDQIQDNNDEQLSPVDDSDIPF